MSDLIHAMPFARQLGIELLEAKPLRVVGTMLITSEHCTVGETANGGALMTFADCLGAIAAYLSLPEGAGGTTTIESKTNLLKAAAVGLRLRGVSTPISAGKRISVWETKLFGEDEDLIALTLQTQLVIWA